MASSLVVRLAVRSVEQMAGQWDDYLVVKTVWTRVAPRADHWAGLKVTWMAVKMAAKRAVKTAAWMVG